VGAKWKCHQGAAACESGATEIAVIYLSTFVSARLAVLALRRICRGEGCGRQMEWVQGWGLANSALPASFSSSSSSSSSSLYAQCGVGSVAPP